MKQENRLSQRFREIANTLIRFPVTGILLLAAVITNAFLINSENASLNKLLITLFIGASVSIVLQMVDERLFSSIYSRIIFIAVTLISTIIYYLLIHSADMGVRVMIKTSAFLFFLLILFLWIPSFKSIINFNQSFLAIFKAFFITLFFNGVIFIGTSLILAAINMLIIKIQGRAYMHAANIIFIFFAPVYLLSLIPIYPGMFLMKYAMKMNADINQGRNKLTASENLEIEDNDSDTNLSDSSIMEEDYLTKAVSSTKFLESLISYVIIPITIIFTFILLIYIITNITGRFWKDNLMEPMLVAYSIVVIIVYILASSLENSFATFFRKVFPKILIPVVLFQTISSVRKIGDIGVTYGRYYVILFGIFSTVAGIFFCIIPIKKNGMIALILMILSIISIVPPVDAFTVSRINQENRLEKALIRNQMLRDNTIQPNSAAVMEDQKIIAGSINYLTMTGDLKNIALLKDYAKSMDFKKTFGFDQYAGVDKSIQNIYFYRDLGHVISVTGYDYYLRTNVSPTADDNLICSFDKGGLTYQLISRSNQANGRDIVVNAPGDKEILRFPVQDIFSRYMDKKSLSNLMSIEEASFYKESKDAAIAVVVDSVNINQWEGGKDQTAEINILIKIK